MVWEKRIRSLSWVCFLLMWIPLGLIVYTGITEGDENVMNMAMVPFVVLCILFAVSQIGSFGVGWLEREKIRKKGIPAKATIVSVADTGTMINNQPLLSIELDVHPPCDSPFRTTVEYVVPYSALPQVQPGTTIQVYYIEGSAEVALADL